MYLMMKYRIYSPEYRDILYFVRGSVKYFLYRFSLRYDLIIRGIRQRDHDRIFSRQVHTQEHTRFSHRVLWEKYWLSSERASYRTYFLHPSLLR